MKLTPALLAHFADNYVDFLALHRAGIIDYATACDWCNRIWGYIQVTYYSKAKAA
jgi:hypothetical protein